MKDFSKFYMIVTIEDFRGDGATFSFVSLILREHEHYS